MTKYPNIKVKLTGQDGNIFNIIGLVGAALRKAGVSGEDRSAFSKQAFSAGSYDKALAICMEWVSVK